MRLNDPASFSGTSSATTESVLNGTSSLSCLVSLLAPLFLAFKLCFRFIFCVTIIKLFEVISSFVTSNSYIEMHAVSYLSPRTW